MQRSCDFFSPQFHGVELGVLRLRLKTEAFLESRLKAGLPTLFYLWTPHIFHTEFVALKVEASLLAVNEDWPSTVVQTHLVAAKLLAVGNFSVTRSLSANSDGLNSARMVPE